MKKFPVLILAGLLLAGCKLIGPNDPDGPEFTELDAAREAWAALGLDNYDVEMVRGCFCIGGGRLSVLVRDDSVAAVFPQDDYWSGEIDWWQYIPTVDELFDLIEDAQQNADSWEVQYSDDGYPTRIDIDWITNAIDDEISYTISMLTPVAASAQVILSLGEAHDVPGASILFERVDEESRCATGTVCIWAGRAILSITVSLDHDSVVLSLVDGATREGESRQGTAGPVTLTLTKVTPYPRDGAPVSFSEYKAHLLIDSN